jgi:uncharacterized protein (TIGR00251 family)
VSETTPLKILTVQVVPNAKVQKLVVQKEGLKVWVNAPAHDGQANRAVIEQLARHLNLKKNQVQLVRGQKSRTKQFAIFPEGS